ncbi:hypothetical protein ACLQ3B_22305 [Micromonospora sp. DT53]|uniref:hypothetical protein n=1 Tax=Micromonospora sp. DT53 TaxID=3393444 RepID=UPI003CEDAE0C
MADGSDSAKEACGVFGVRDPRQPVAHLTYLGLFALQHRGQESAGIAVSDGTKILVDKDMGLVSAIFDEHRLRALPGTMAIGQRHLIEPGHMHRFRLARALVRLIRQHLPGPGLDGAGALRHLGQLPG